MSKGIEGINLERKMMKIIVVSSNQEHLEPIRQMLLSVSPTRQVSVFEGEGGKLKELLEKHQPNIVILDDICCKTSELRVLEQLSMSHPGMNFIMLSEQASSEFLLNAMRAGIREVLQLPLAPQTLLDAVARIEKRGVQDVPKKLNSAKVIAFIACKGGSGATFIASNLGYILANQENSKVVLLDLNLQFGDAVLFVADQSPSNTLADLPENIDRLDASLLDAFMVHVLPNYGVLAAPEDPERAVGIRPEHIEILLKLAIENYDFVLLDIGRILTSTTLKALDHADLIFPILQETLPFIRDSKRLIRTLQTLGYARDKIHPVVNRYMKGGEIRLEDVESALDMKVSGTIPNSYEAVSASVNQGIPIQKIASHDPVTIALEEMAYELTNEQHQHKTGWLSHLFHSA